MELYQIRYLEAAIRHSAVGRAAQELNVSQPAVTRAIKRLESELGIRLIVSNTRGIEPTDYGQLLYTHAQSILAGIKDATDELQTIKTSGSKVVSIGVTPMINKKLFGEFLKSIFARSEDVAVNINEGSLSRHVVALRSGNLDFVVGMIQPEFVTGEIACEVLYNTRQLPYARIGHPIFSRQAILSLADLHAYEFAIYRPEAITDIFRNWLHDAQVRSIRIGLKSNSPDVLMAATLETDLITFLPDHFAEQAVEQGLIRQVETSFLNIEFEAGILQLRGSRTTRAKLMIYEQLRKLMAAQCVPSPMSEPVAARG